MKFWRQLCIGIGLLLPVWAWSNVPVTGINPGFVPQELAAVDALVKAWMARTGTPGFSFALSRNGALVLTRAYGYADVERKEAMSPGHRLRIASVSKPITSAAIARLVQQGKLAFNSQVFGNQGMLGTAYGSKPYHQWLYALNVDHLLTHTSGAWPNSHNDPMFFKPAWSLRRVIDYTLDTLPLSAPPGAQYAYSNFGYALLGRIIERRSKLSYEQYVRQHLLAPMGINRMEIGGNTLAERKADEARYYPAASSYSMNIRRMDAHGGWIATPADLLRFTVRVDGFPSVADQLPANFLKRMYTPSAANANYARGWSVNASDNYWHDGSLPGTSAVLVRTGNGYGWAGLANSRPAETDRRGELDRLMWQIKKALRYWPPVNLF